MSRDQHHTNEARPGPGEREAGLVSTLHRFSDLTQVPGEEDISVRVAGPSTAAAPSLVMPREAASAGIFEV